MYSRQTQKLIHWIIGCFANEHNGKAPNAKVNKIEMEEEKANLNEEFKKVYGEKLIKKPLHTFLEVLEHKDNISVDQLQESFINALQSLFIEKKRFSLALELLTQEEANDIVAHLYNLALENGVELRKEINDLFHEQQQERYIFIHLLKKKCVVCGKYADLDHWDNVSQIGGYKFDDGQQTRFLPICREHHTIKHNLGRDNFTKKYGYKGMSLNEKQVEMLLPVYPNHFKAYRKRRRDGKN